MTSLTSSGILLWATLIRNQFKTGFTGLRHHARDTEQSSAICKPQALFQNNMAKEMNLRSAYVIAAHAQHDKSRVPAEVPFPLVS
jgi:hypothetical protein